MDLEQRIAQLSPAQLALLERKLKKGKPNNQPKSQNGGGQPQKYAPLSFSQERLWFLEQMEPESCIYNLPALLPLYGPVDPALVEESIRQIVARHSALRTCFVVRDDSPRQVIADDAAKALDFSVIDLRAASTQSNSQDLSNTINDGIWTPFNLATGPLLRVRLILRRNHANILLVVIHHIVSDGWSINIFTREFRALYESAATGRACALAPVQQYVDYSLAQRKVLQGERLASLLSYWRGRLDGAPSLLAMPLDRPRPARQSFKGALYPFSVSSSTSQRVKSLCRESGVVPFMVLLSAFNILLFRYTNQPKILVGTPIANRNRSELEEVIGFFTNTLVLSSSVAPDMSFRELLAQVRDTTLGAYEHQELPFEKLVSELQPERSLSHNPLFQVMFILQNLPTEKSAVKDPARPVDQSANALSFDVKFSKFDLTLAMTEADDGLSAVFEYATDLFETKTIERMAGHFVNILEYLLQNPDEKLAGFSFLPREERDLILDKWNDTGRIWSEILPLHGRFEKWVRETPNATALTFRGESLTYQELDRAANRVAGLLRSRGAAKGSIVAICLHRSTEMLIGLFAILKAGAAYMPIDPDFPAERVGYMLDNARVAHVLTRSQHLSALSTHRVDAIALDTLEFDGETDGEAGPPVSVNPADPAYVIYTSGSTGQPKGVLVSHGAIFNRLRWMQEQYGLSAADRVMQKTPFTFDVSVWEFFWPLSEGACLVIAEPDRHKESAYLVELIRERSVTCLHFVPSMLQLFLHEDLSGCVSLNRIFCSGEALTVEQCRRLRELPGISAHNLYGPTEAAVDVTHWDCDQWHDQYLSVPIGRPIANTQIYILNEYLHPVPIGVPGELYIGGTNLADGYVNNPELTERQFVGNPFGKIPGAHLYKTGDLARFRADGNIEYIGRIDSQVKVRGVRIELGEIEYTLCQYPGVAEATVVVNRFGDHDDRLVAYVVLDRPGTALDTNAVAAFAGKKLPSYMIPSVIMALPKLPLTANGKLDRKNLPEPKITKASQLVESVSAVESELLGFWRKFLKVDTLDIDDDFFDLGGHSILVTQVVNSINGYYHLSVPVRLLFENPTVRTLAKALSEFEDETWLDESKAVAAILMRSNIRLLRTVDEMSEEQIDDLLRQHLDDTTLARFEDTDSLIEWSRSSAPPHDVGTKAEPPATGLVPDQDPDTANAIYLRCYLDLMRTKATIEVLSRRYQPFYPLPPAADDAVAQLQVQGGQLFESYAQRIKQRLSEAGNGTMSPDELTNHCAQLLNLAELAASIQGATVR
jgi:amino acid adenylation domain-containing protein